MIQFPSIPTTIAIEEIAACTDFCRLQAIEGIRIDLRYATSDNFVGRNVYAGFDCAWLHREAAIKLAHAARLLAQRAPDRSIVVLDALRPHRVQEALWSTLAGTELSMYLAPPAVGSLHSYGMAVDVTLVEATGEEVDMGTPFDHMSPLAHPEFEHKYASNGSLTQGQLNNRQCLRAAMEDAGFFPIATEWWHFDATRDRAHVRAAYPRII